MTLLQALAWAVVASGVWWLLGVAGMAFDTVLGQHYLDRWRPYADHGLVFLLVAGPVGLVLLGGLALFGRLQRAALRLGAAGCRHPSIFQPVPGKQHAWCANCGAYRAEIGGWARPSRRQT